MTQSYTGIFIPTHKIIDTDSKEKATKTLSGWQFASLTAKEWIEKLTLGQTIQPSAFTPKPDGSFTHKVENWVSTHFVCADADNIKGVEFLDDGSDKNPEGVEPWTENGLLSKKFPGLTAKVYAVGESVSSMLVDPLHRRYRFVFVFNEPITSEKHYHHILIKFADAFPIIPNVTRSPAQPVFGNAREEFNFHICGNILNLTDYLMGPEINEIKQPIKNKQESNETLQEFLNRHNIAYEPSNDSNKFYVECPYKNGHTNGKSGKTDAYVFGDAAGWAFNCSHTSCKQAGLTTWENFKEGSGIKSRTPIAQPTQKNQAYHASDPPVWTEDDIEQSDEVSDIVPFPKDLFFGIFKSYRDALENRTPVPDAFAFATLKHIISASLGRRIHLESQIPIFPNLYTGLIGASSEGHKGVSLTVAQKLLQKADPNVLVLTRTATEEGLIDMFVTPELKTGKNDEGEDFNYYINGIADLLPHERVDEIVANIDSHESVRVMGNFEELSAVLNRSKKITFSGITETFMELYDMKPEILIGNKQNKSRADFPTFTMIGASALELIEQSLAQHFITAGFTNRIEWYLGEEKDPIFIYKPAEIDGWTDCVNAVERLRDSYIVGQSFNLTDTAYNLGDHWNKQFSQEHKQIENLLVAGSMKRMKIFIIKNALIFAALEHRGDFKIHDDDILRAILLAEYNCTVVEKLFENFASSEHQKVCNRIVEVLKKNPLMSPKQVQNQMRWADIREIDLALDLMLKLEILGFQKPKRTIQYFVTKNQESE